MADEPVQSPATVPQIHASLLQRSLDIRSLPVKARLWVLAAIFLAAAAGALILFAGLGGNFPGGVDVLPAAYQPFSAAGDLQVPRVGSLFLLAGLTFSAAALGYGSGLPGWRFSWFTRFTIGLTGLALCAQVVGMARLFEIVAGKSTGFWILYTLLALVGWEGVVLSALLVVIPNRAARWSPPLVAAISAAPMLCIIAAYLILIPRLSLVSALNQPEVESGLLLMTDLVNRLVNLFPILLFATGVYLFWQAIVQARLANREFGVNLANRISGKFWLLGAFLLLKILYLFAGYAGLYPGDLGQAFENSRMDGIVSWLLAVVLAGLIFYWLWRQPFELKPAGFGAVTLLVVIAFNFLYGLAHFLVLSYLVWFGFSESLDISLGAILGNFLVDAQVYVQFLLIVIAPFLGILLLIFRKGKYRTAGILLIGIGMWNFFRAINVFFDLILNHPFPIAHGNVDYLTFDAVLTAFLILLALLWFGNRKRKTEPWPIALVLVVSTLAGLFGSVLENTSIPWIYFGLLVLPFAYTLLLDAQALNQPGPDRPARVLGWTALTAFLLVVVAYSTLLGRIGPGVDTLEDLANIVFVPPYLFVLMGITISGRGLGEGKESF